MREELDVAGPAGWSVSLPVIGVDFGANRLRVAVDGPLGPRLVQSSGDEWLPRLVRRRGANGDLELVALKNLLDFEASVPVGPAGVPSQEYVARILRERSGAARAASGNGQAGWVLAVPPCFSQRQRSALRGTAAQADFERVVLVDDTLATLLQRGELLPNGENQRPLVFSWGAGSFSAVVYERRRLSYQAVGQDGDRNLGGDLLDSFVASALAAQVRSAVGEAWKQEREFHGHLVREAEQAKRVLLTGKALRVPLGRVCPTVASRSAGELVLNLEPDALLGLFEQLLDQALERTVQALRACGAEQPSSILLVGGCANLPPVRDALALRFGVPIHSAGEGDVACGAVLHGRMLGDQDWTTANGPPVAPAGPAPQSAPAVRWAERFSPFLDKAQQLEAQGRAVEALSAFEELQTELGRLSASIYVRVAKEREGEGREQEAVAVLERAIERDRTNYAVARALGDLCYRRAVKHYEARRFDAALAESLKGADALGLEQRRPGAPPTRLAELKHLQALALQATGRLDAAEAAMAEAARLDPAQKVFREDLDRLRAARKAAPKPVPVSTQAKPGRNELCPCGSGRKYKRCHGH